MVDYKICYIETGKKKVVIHWNYNKVNVRNRIGELKQKGCKIVSVHENTVRTNPRSGDNMVRWRAVPSLKA